MKEKDAMLFRWGSCVHIRRYDFNSFNRTLKTILEITTEFYLSKIRYLTSCFSFFSDGLQYCFNPVPKQLGKYSAQAKQLCFS